MSTNDTVDTIDSSRHYQVVRFFPNFFSGMASEILGSDLTVEEAKQIAEQYRQIPAEDVVIQDQQDSGWSRDAGTKVFSIFEQQG